MSIWLTQWLCPARHCAFAAAWDDTDTTPAMVVAEAGRTRVAAGLEDRCGICGADELHAEHGRTIFLTMAAALPVLRAMEAQQLRTRRILDELGFTAAPGHRDES